MRPSRFLAAAAFLGLVPAVIAAAHAGYRSGLYPYAAIPVVFGVLFAVAVVGLFALLPIVRRRLG